MKKQKGYTTVELMLTVVILALAGGALYVAVHFISKWW